MLALQIKIEIHHTKTICSQHEQELLKKFSLQQRNCSDSLNIHPSKQKKK